MKKISFLMVLLALIFAGCEKVEISKIIPRNDDLTVFVDKADVMDVFTPFMLLLEKVESNHKKDGSSKNPADTANASQQVIDDLDINRLFNPDLPLYNWQNNYYYSDSSSVMNDWRAPLKLETGNKKGGEMFEGVYENYPGKYYNAFGL